MLCAKLPEESNRSPVLDQSRTERYRSLLLYCLWEAVEFLLVTDSSYKSYFITQHIPMI
jgi:hypothetical protein